MSENQEGENIRLQQNFPPILIRVSSFEDEEGGYTNPAVDMEEADSYQNNNDVPEIVVNPSSVRYSSHPRREERPHGNGEAMRERPPHEHSPRPPKSPKRLRMSRRIRRESEREKEEKELDYVNENYCLICENIRQKWERTPPARRRAMKIMFFAGTLVFATIIILYTYKDYLTASNLPKNAKVCRSMECMRTAVEIESSLDVSVDPCDNFYEYSCGGWKNKNPFPPDTESWDRFSKYHEEIMFKIKRILEKKPKDKELRAFKNARKMYKACTNTDLINNLGMKPIIETLKYFGDMPMISDEWNEGNFDWVSLLGNLQRTFLFRILFSVSISRDDKNEDRNILYLSQVNIFGKSAVIAQNNTEERIKFLRTAEWMVELLIKQKNSMDSKDPVVPPTASTTTQSPPLTNGTKIDLKDGENDITSENADSLKSNNRDSNKGTATTDTTESNTEEPLEDVETSTTSENTEELSDQNEGNPEERKIPTKSNFEDNKIPDTPTQPKNKLTEENKEPKENIQDNKKLPDESILSDKGKLPDESELPEMRTGSPEQTNSLKEEHKKDSKSTEVDPELDDFSLLNKEKGDPSEHNRNNVQEQALVKGAQDSKQSFLTLSQFIYKEINDIWNFLVRLTKIMDHKPHLLTEEEKYNLVTIKELMEYDSNGRQVNWLQFFELLLEDTQVKVTEEYKVVIRIPNFFKEFSKVMHDTPKRTIANTIMYLLVNEMSGEVRTTVGTDSRSPGDTDDVTGYRSVINRPWFSCTSRVIGAMEHAVTSLYVRENYDSYLKDIGIINEVVDNLQDQFVEHLNRTSWMDESTRKAALKKAEEMRSLVGFSEKYVDEIMVDTYYMHYPEMDEENHFSNMIESRKYFARTRIADVEKSPQTRNRWTIKNLEANAFYSFEENSIQIPVGIFGPPFYRNVTKSMLYGGIGMVIGHEILHAFDSIGKSRNWKGLLEDWWSTESLEQFHKKTKCYETAYSELPVTMNVTHANGTMIKVDGKLTKAENIADNEGFLHAWNIYQKKKEREELRLVGIEHISSDQLFFISFGQMFCGNIYPKELVNSLQYNVHTPHAFRINGVIRNSPQFADVFRCSPKAKMVSDMKCSLW